MRAVIIIALNNRVNKKKEREKKRNNFIKLDWTCVTWNGSHFVSFDERTRKERKELIIMRVKRVNS